jgi:ATPase subunit of ABC transporter with duplicated ATPase domains
MQHHISTQHLCFAYENTPEPLFNDISLQLSFGWTGIVGANGSGKSTFLKLICGLLQPVSGSIHFDDFSYYCEQRTDEPPKELAVLIDSVDRDAFRLKNRLNINDDWQQRWPALSHGERKRCQIACALYQSPTCLALDEPTNHLDSTSRRLLIDALASFRGIGLVVSHDRLILDTLTHQTILMSPPGIIHRNCSYSVAIHELEKEKLATLHKVASAKKQVKRIHKTMVTQQKRASKAKRQNSKQGLNPRDHDAKAKKDLGRLTGKDAVQANIQKRINIKLDRAREHLQDLRVEKQNRTEIQLTGLDRTSTFPLISAPTEMQLGDAKWVYVPELVIEKGEKIGLVGDNGTGKSTLIRHLVDQLFVPKNEMIYIPQEIPVKISQGILQRILDYNSTQKGQIMTLVKRLGSDPEFLLQSAQPSPGQVRKLLLAEGIMLAPVLIIMDEPTNHMDLPSIECLETALADTDIAQILVSHDHLFLQNIVHRFWVFENAAGNTFMVKNANDLPQNF